MWTEPARRRRQAMTLLEVLAAVALLGIVFTALSRSATLGVLSEGDSRRRLQASLLADSRLTQLELAASAGVLPEIGVTEEEQDEFLVVIETDPWSLPPRLAEERELRTGRPTSEVFGNPGLAQAGLVREVRLTVAWNDGVEERSVGRTTYLVDFAGIAESGLPLPGLLGGALQEALQGAVDAATDGTRPSGGEATR